MDISNNLFQALLKQQGLTVLHLFPDGLCFYCIIDIQYVIVFHYDGYDR